MKMINKSNTRKGILIVFVPFGTLIQSVATKSDQPSAVSKVSVENEASETEGRRVFFYWEKIKTVIPLLTRLFI